MVHWSALCDTDPVLYSKYLEVASRYVDTLRCGLSVGVGSGGSLRECAGDVVEADDGGASDGGDGEVHADVGGQVRSLVEGLRGVRIGGRRCGASAGDACACVFGYSQCSRAGQSLGGGNWFCTGGNGHFGFGVDRFGDGGSSCARGAVCNGTGDTGSDDDAAGGGVAGTVVEASQDSDECGGDGSCAVAGAFGSGVGAVSELRSVGHTGGGCADEVVSSEAKYVPPHARGVAGAVRGKHYAANKAARERQKRKRRELGERSASVAVEDERSVRGSSFASCSVEQRSQLQQSRAVRLVAENELKAAEAVRKLELLQAQDVAQLKKRQETRLMRDTELNKVQVEQAFGKLAGTGNVPGFAQTVVSSEGTPQLVSGSISPNSSASMAEIHAMQKENLEYRRRMEVLMKESPDLYAKVLAAKLPSEETGWSIDENGWPKGNIGDGVGGMIGPDGRLHDYDDYADY